MRSYEKILNPKTKRFVSVFSKTGQSILRNYVRQINSNQQTGGRVSLPSEFFGRNSGRYLEAASGTRNTAGGETVGNGLEPYSVTTQKGGAVPSWVADWMGHGHHKRTLKYITKYVMEQMQNEHDEEKIFEKIIQGYFTYVQDGPALDVVVRQTIWYMKKYYWVLNQDRFNILKKKNKNTKKKNRKKWSKQEQTKFNKARKHMEKKDREVPKIVGGAFGAHGLTSGTFNDTGDSFKDGQKDAEMGKKDKERYSSDDDYAKAYDKSVAKEIAKED